MDFNLSVINIIEDVYKDSINNLINFLGHGSEYLSVKLEDKYGNIFWGCHSWWKPEDFTYFLEVDLVDDLSQYEEARSILKSFTNNSDKTPLDSWEEVLEVLGLVLYEDKSFGDLT